MKALTYSLAALALFAVPSPGENLQELGEQSSHFYLKPTKERYDKLQRDADSLAGALRKRGNGADLMTAVMIARISQKYHWDISGKGKESEMAREIIQGNSRLANYVASDALVDPGKLDIWWASFFATGEKEYLGKILRYAEIPKRGPVAKMLVQGAAAWSFKSNCRQHKAVAAFAKECLSNNLFPEKKEFLRECVRYAENNGSPVRAGAAEPKMEKIVTRLISPTMQPNSFAAKVKTFYHAGNKYARVEEGVDAALGIHGLIITSEPDSWMINLADNTGRHFVDPGPIFEMHAPVFWVAKPKGQPDPDKEFKEFEFGNETQFFREHGAHEAGMRNVEGSNYRALSLKRGAREVILLLDPSTGKPHQIDVIENGKLGYSIRYLSYETNLPFRKSLFQPPKGVKITEAR